MSFLVNASLGASPAVDSSPREWPQQFEPRNRVAFAAAATTGLSSELMRGFDAAAPTVWLASAPHVTELAVVCDRKP